MTTKDTQRAFEAWAENNGNRLPMDLRKDEKGFYIVFTTSMLYEAWNAGIAHATPSPSAPVGQLPEKNCPHCGTHEISLERTCHHSACTAYANQETIYEGWKKQAEAARQPAPVVEQRKLPELPNTTFSTEVAGYKIPVFGAQHMRDYAIAALAATAAPVKEPHYRMSENPKAWLHTLPEGKFFNSDEGENSQLFIDGEEATDECNFYGGTLTPLYTAEWTQAGIDHIKTEADKLYKKIAEEE